MVAIIANEQDKTSIVDVFWQKVRKLEWCFEKYMKQSNQDIEPLEIAERMRKDIYEPWSISNITEDMVLDRWEQINIKINEKAEKYVSLKCGMSLSEVENILNHELVLRAFEKEYDTHIGIGLRFTDTKILDCISFDATFSLTVDGIGIGMDKNEVIKIKGIPDEKTDDDPEMEFWFYNTKNTFYTFVENKIDQIFISLN
jgi:hypothetical protein